MFCETNEIYACIGFGGTLTFEFNKIVFFFYINFNWGVIKRVNVKFYFTKETSQFWFYKKFAMYWYPLIINIKITQTAKE